MLIVDSSGSMEYTRITHHVPTCTGDPLLDDENERTRWMMILDALLGPVYADEYACQVAYPDVPLTYYESGIEKTVTMTKPAYHILPHFVALGERDVTFGVMERYREFIRFGLSTFDSFESEEAGEDGMFSYGPVFMNRNVGVKKPVVFAGGVWEDIIPGAMVSWGGDSQSMDMTNYRIRKELSQTMPYCGSPVAAALDDMEYFFTMSSENQGPSDSGLDRFFDCRDRFVILITDGRPNTGEGTWYKKSFEEAADLWALSPKVPLYIIWIPTCPKDEINPLSEWNLEKALMDEIAHAGCPPTDALCPAGVYPVENTKEIMNALESILYRAMKKAVSRTVPLTTNLVGENAAAGVMQYQFNTSFIPHEDGPWEGILERSGYICNAADEIELTSADYVEYGAQLDVRVGPRTIYTALDPLTKASGSALDVFETTNPAITAGALGDSSKDAVWVEEIVDFVHGRDGALRDPANTSLDPAGGNRLGDPFHASAAMIGPPVADLPFLSYYQYQEDEKDRVPVIFLATNMGMVHAFRIQNTGNAAEKGQELWSYIPGTLLPKVAHQVPASHIWGADSTPVAGDVRLFKDDDDDSTDEDWMAVLVGGYRQGGFGYYALDVSDPLSPKYLWEITNKKAGFDKLRETYATPLLGTVFTSHPTLSSNPLGEIGVVIFPGGYNPANREGSTGLYIVTADEGVLLKELAPEFPSALGCPGSPDCNAHPECCAQMITSPVGFAATPGYLTTRVFVGDDRGRVWRADLSSNDPAKWHLNLFYPVQKDVDEAPYTVGEPVESPIGLAMNENGKLVTIFGTGDIDDITGMTQNYIFSVTEQVEYDGSTATYYGKPQPNWMITLEEGEKLTGQPIIFNKITYFTTFVPYTNAANLCEYGAGRIWGVHYMKEDPNDDGDTSDFGMLDTDGVPDGDGTLEEYMEYTNTIISGLTVVQRPSCLGIDPDSGLPLSSGAQEVYQIVAQASGSGGVKAGPQQTPTITIQIPSPVYRNLAESWGSLLQ
jgi:type IV pilus assembly protein PilY1